MKRIISVLLSVLLIVCCLCGCSKYKLQENIRLNYNNVNNQSDFWLTNDSVCYFASSRPFVPCTLIDTNSKRYISYFSSDRFCEAQRYGNKIYLLGVTDGLDTRNDNYSFKVYDVDTKKTEKIGEARNVDRFLVLNEDIYFQEYSWNGDEKVFNLNKCSVSDGKIENIANAVMTFGVIDNSLVYIIADKNNVVIYKYNSDKKLSEELAKIPFDDKDVKDGILNSYNVSFTEKYVLFLSENVENNTSSITKYSFESGKTEVNKFDNFEFIFNFVAFDKYTYFTDEIFEDVNKYTLYKFDNETSEITEIAKFDGLARIFVGSDDGAYVWNADEGNIKFYSNQGSSEIVCDIR